MNKRPSRRAFLKGAAAASLAFAPSLQAGDEPKQNPLAATAQALTEIVRVRYAKHVTNAQIKSVQQGISGSLQSADMMKRTRLENSDEPDFVFFAEGP